jgi:hypothetical protein
MNIPEKFKQNIKTDINYQIKVSPAVIKVPFTDDKTKLKVEKDAVGNDIQYIMHEGKWYEIVHEVHKDYKGKKEDHFLIRVDKKTHPKAYPFNGFGYFVLPPELEAVYGKRCKVLTDICFLSNEVDKLFSKVGHAKFDNSALACAGDGIKANRYNPVTEMWEKVPCVCGFSRYYSDYTEEELATEFTITKDTPKELYREIKKFGNDSVFKQVLVQGAWRDIVSKDPNGHIQLKPFTDNKPPCDFNFELLFAAPKAPGLHLNKLHSTGLENYLRIEKSIQTYKEILTEFRISLRTQPMNLVLRLAEGKSKKYGKTIYPQVSVEFAQSIMELVKRSAKNTYLTEPEAVKQIPEYVNIDTGEVFEEVEEGNYEEETIQEVETEFLFDLKEKVQLLKGEINVGNDDPNYVENYFNEHQIVPADTEDSLNEQLTILESLKLKLF